MATSWSLSKARRKYSERKTKTYAQQFPGVVTKAFLKVWNELNDPEDI